MTTEIEQQLEYVKNVLNATRTQLSNAMAVNAELEINLAMVKKTNEALNARIESMSADKDGDN